MGYKIKEKKIGVLVTSIVKNALKKSFILEQNEKKKKKKENCLKTIESYLEIVGVSAEGLALYGGLFTLARHFWKNIVALCRLYLFRKVFCKKYLGNVI